MTESEQVSTEQTTDQLPANQSDFVEVEFTPTERVEAAADGLGAFNSVLWEIAKSFGIITVILLFVFTLFMAFLLAQWGMSVL